MVDTIIIGMMIYVRTAIEKKGEEAIIIIDCTSSIDNRRMIVCSSKTTPPNILLYYVHRSLSMDFNAIKMIVSSRGVCCMCAL